MEQRVTDIPIIPMASQKNTVTDNLSKKKVMIVVDQNGFLKKKKKDKKDKKKEKEKKKEEKVKLSLESDEDSYGTVCCTVDLWMKQLSRNGQYRIDSLNNKFMDLCDWMEDLQKQNKVSVQTMFFVFFGELKPVM